MIVCLNWRSADHRSYHAIALILKFHFTIISYDFITNRAITDGNIELLGNECLKEILDYM